MLLPWQAPELGTARCELWQVFTRKRMDEPSPNPEVAASDELTRRGLSAGEKGARLDGPGHRGQVTTEPRRVEIVLRISATQPQQIEASKPVVENPAQAGASPSGGNEVGIEGVPPVRNPQFSLSDRQEPVQIPARMLNEFVYCRRLFYYEFVEGVFVESADTLRGAVIHQRVDTGTGGLPAAKRKADAK